MTAGEAKVKVVVTCEHGGNEIPFGYADAFKESGEVLQTHRGYDKGALELFHKFSAQADFSHYSTTSRLLIELNRSLHHGQLFSEFTKELSNEEKEHLIAYHYTPYRQRIEEEIANFIAQGNQVLHLSVHSFTPELDGKVRKADVGLLYDPSREREQLFAAQWRQHLQQEQPHLKIRYNYPYKGTADGFVTQLRKEYSNRHYAGLELEVNQRFPEQGQEPWQLLQTALVSSFWLAV